MNRTIAAAAAAGLVALVLPVAGLSPAGAVATPGGYSTTSWATPIRVELYEPTVPLPSTPQGEANVAFTRTTSSSGQSTGLASWLWPGDSVGTGFKTFAEAFGLPAEIGEGGYPFQVNSSAPGGEQQQADEPLPGLVMRTSSSPERSRAQAGFASDGNVDPGDSQEPGSDGPAPDDDPLGQLSAALSAPSSKGVLAAEEEPSGNGLPPELAALVDAGGVNSVSTATIGDAVVSGARSAASDISIAAGLLRVDAVTSQVRATSDSKDASAQGRTVVGGLAVAGQPFTIGPDGIELAGEGAPIPGLPDDPAKALKQLGVAVALQPVQRKVEDRAATSTARGLRIEIDMVQLRSQLGDLPLADVVGAIPDETGELKKVLQAVTFLAPRVVITLGGAVAEAQTVDGIELPDVDPGDLPAAGAGGGGDGGATGGAGSTTPGTGGTGSAPAPEATTDAAPPTASPAAGLDDAQLTAGLPELASIPGVLTYGGIALAVALGAWLRRLGLLALGGAAACAHGFETGLPDLRKA